MQNFDYLGLSIEILRTGYYYIINFEKLKVILTEKKIEKRVIQRKRKLKLEREKEKVEIGKRKREKEKVEIGKKKRKRKS